MQRNQKRACLSLVASLTIILIGVAIVAVSADDISTTIAKAEPPIRQHSYLAGRVALDPGLPPRFLSLFYGGDVELRGR